MANSRKVTVIVEDSDNYPSPMVHVANAGNTRLITGYEPMDNTHMTQVLYDALISVDGIAGEPA